LAAVVGAHNVLNASKQQQTTTTTTYSADHKQHWQLAMPPVDSHFAEKVVTVTCTEKEKPTKQAISIFMIFLRSFSVVD